MTDWVVGCPDCGTHFRVTEAHRSAASGLVRCGGCLTVFRAEAHRVDTPVVQAPDAHDDPGAGAEPDDLDNTEEQTTLVRDRMRSVHASRHRSVLETADAGAADPEPDDARGGAVDPEADGVPAEQVPDLDVPISFDVARMHRQEILPPPLPAARRSWPWWLLAAAALVALAGQGLYWRFDALATDPQVRPLLSRACALVGCDLPEPRVPGAIRSQRLLVRSDPDQPGALLVDVVLVNRAPWPQPFPDLELRFASMDGAPVAARRFAPAEYLGGELSGRRTMPPDSPVQIALELVDPGPDAVNYELDVL